MECQHKWVRSTWGKANITEICSTCGTNRDRCMTKNEKRWFSRFLNQGSKSDGLHKQWAKFKVALDDRQGWPAIQRAEKFIKRRQDRFYPLYVDDTTHSTSLVVLHVHEDQSHLTLTNPDPEPYFMGVSVKFIPQASNDESTFFLYPDNLDSFIEVLKAIRKRVKAYPSVKRERRHR